MNQGVDNTGEVSYATLTGSENLICTNQISDLADCDFYIVAVPTPVSANNVPDLEPLFGACRSLSGVLADGDIVVFESTVYPGATEEDCAKLIEQISGLKSFSADDLGGSQAKGYFYLGYSPERVNPGDPSRKITDIVKVVSACDAETLDIVDKVYSSIIAAGTYRASSIRVAEAAKVIENIQRDVNIALVNELAMLFHKMDISTKDVLDAAKNELEFLNFIPGLVGGHCIGVDPYYLTHKAQQFDFKPEMILAGRKTNNQMSKHVSDRIQHIINENELNGPEVRLLMMGATFKENCPDTRNSKVFDLIFDLVNLDINVDVHDPWISQSDFSELNGIRLVKAPEPGSYDIIVIAVAHSKFRQMGSAKIRSFGKQKSFLFDLKYVFPAEETDHRL